MKTFIYAICAGFIGVFIQIGMGKFMKEYYVTLLSIFFFLISGGLFIWFIINALYKVWTDTTSGLLTESIRNLVFALVILVILSTFLNLISAYKIWKPPEISEQINESLRADKIKETIRRWLSVFGNGSTIMESKNDEFCLGVNLPSSLLLSIAKSKQYPQYISIRASIVPSEEHLKLLRALSPKQIKQIILNLIIEIDRLHLESSHLFLKQIESPRPSIERIYLEKRLPITNNLTEDVFIRAVNEMESDERLIAFMLIRDLEK